MNFKYYRRLFCRPAVKGTITFNGVQYVDEESMLKTFPNAINGESDLGWDIPKEADVLPDNMIFCKKSAANILEEAQQMATYFGRDIN